MGEELRGNQNEPSDQTSGANMSDMSAPFVPPERPLSPASGAASARDHDAVEVLLQRVQELEDLVEELIEIALVNRAGLLTSMSKGALERDEIKRIYDRIEAAHEQARASDEAYRILPGAAAYFLEDQQ